jgi:hypothetical protein
VSYLASEKHFDFQGVNGAAQTQEQQVIGVHDKNTERILDT